MKVIFLFFTKGASESLESKVKHLLRCVTLLKNRGNFLKHIPTQESRKKHDDETVVK